MIEPYYSDLVFLLGFGAAVVAIPVFTLLAFRWLRPTHEERIKDEAYESGLPQASIPRRPFHMAYYAFALAFIVFEVESVLLFAVAPILKNLGWVALAEVIAFVFSVALGFFYAWRKGVLTWH